MNLLQSIQKNRYTSFIADLKKNEITYSYQLAYELDSAIERQQMIHQNQNVFIRDIDFAEDYFLEQITRPDSDIRFIDLALYIGLPARQILAFTIKSCGEDTTRVQMVRKKIQELYPSLPSFEDEEKTAS